MTAIDCYVNFQETNIESDEFKFNDVCAIGGKIDFAGTIFKTDLLNFNSVISDNIVRFLRISFVCKEIRFYRSEIHTLQFINCEFDCAKAEFQMKCTTLIFNEGVNKSIINLKNLNGIKHFCIYEFSNLGRILMLFTPKQLIQFISTSEPVIFVSHTKWRIPDHKDKADQYFTLKQNFNYLGEYDSEDKIYCEYMRENRKSILQSKFHEAKKNLMNVPSFFIYGIFHFLYKYLLCDVMGSYATSPQRVFKTILCVIFLFSCIYMSTFHQNINLLCYDNLCFKNVMLFISAMQESIYLSGSIFLNNGVASGPSKTLLLKYIMLMENFCGIFFMTYFTVAFIRRILR